ncbi:MAG: PQQ-binding-like beta-propeller repeat protein [Verrucomicrobiota bacterium]
MSGVYLVLAGLLSGFSVQRAFSAESNDGGNALRTHELLGIEVSSSGLSPSLSTKTGAQLGDSTRFEGDEAFSEEENAVFVVRWGDPDGATDIVYSSEAGLNTLETTYDSTRIANPPQGYLYYMYPEGFSPAFYGATSHENETVTVVDSGNGDQIRLHRETSPNESFSAMVVWSDFLNPIGNLESFAIKKDDSHWTAEIHFRWVVEMESGEWFASSPIEETGSLVTDKAVFLNWYRFTPFRNGEVSFSVLPTEISLSEVAGVGYYFESKNKSDLERDTGLSVTYFAVTSADDVTNESGGVQSFDTGYTILTVRNAILNGESIIIGASYEGTVVAFDYDGNLLWENPLSGLMVRDVWCDDLNGDGDEEILVAVADGSVRCLEAATGDQMWEFYSPDESNPVEPNEVPMNAVCTVRGEGTKYIACGGFDRNMYWLDVNGNLLATVDSAFYSDLEPWGSASEYMGRNVGKAHTPNFLRPVPQGDGTDQLWMLGFIQQQFRGRFYVFEPLGEFGMAPIPSLESEIQDSIGALEFSDPDGDGNYHLYMGGNSFSIKVESIDLSSGVSTAHEERFIRPFKTYRYSTMTDIPGDGDHRMFILCGNKVIVRSADLSNELGSVVMPHSPNGMWNDRDKGRILFASAQSGGSAIHVVDTMSPYWMQNLRDLDPPGKMRKMKANYADIRKQVNEFVRPSWERVPQTIIEVSGGVNHPTSVALREKYGTVNPFFMTFAHTTNVEKQDWKDSVAITKVEPIVEPVREPYLHRYDNGIKYNRTREELLAEHWQPKIDSSPFGLSFRAGHGNDPYYYSPESLKAAIDASFEKDRGRTTVLSWAEVQSTSDDMKYPIGRLFLDIADYLSTRRGIMAFNNKHLFWGSTVHLEVWSDFIAGDLKNVFSSCMEESTSKTGELSLSHRLGLWASGCFNFWGMRTTRDNTSFDRTRESAAQIVPNHFLRHMIYRLAYGARYSHSTYSDMDYQSLIWELIASGALYLPRREEIVSFSPVHFGIKSEPDERYIESNVISKWSTYYDAAEQAENPMVVGRLEGSWIGARNTEWDFSSFAAGVLDRRQNFIPPYPHGMVLTTPVENGVFASPADNRLRIWNNLHPLYRDILTEFITDGRNYIESDGSETHPANGDFFYGTVLPAVEEGKNLLPVSLSGDDVGWVCAQSAVDRFRLTLIDSGYLNPDDRTVTVHFNTVKPLSMTNVLTGREFEIKENTSTVTVPLGMFLLLDIRLDQPFYYGTDRS